MTEAQTQNGALVEVQSLKKHFPIRKGVLAARGRARARGRRRHAAACAEGETLGLVGESGCGKSTLGRCIVRLLEPTEGDVVFDGQSIAHARRARAAAAAARDADGLPGPVREPEPAQARRLDHRRPAAHPRDRRPRRSARSGSQELLEIVGLSPEHYNRFPHEFSGGQRQRIGVARALALRPEADRRRRARLGARRLDPGADDQPARGAAGRVRPDLPLHRARPRRRPPRLRPDRGHVPRQARRALAGRGALRAPDHALHRGAALGGARSPTPTSPRSASGSCSRATCRARSTRRAAAASTRAAATRPRSAQQVEPPLVDYGNGHLAACHHPLNVDEATLARVQASPAHTPEAADRERFAAGSGQRTGRAGAAIRVIPEKG